MGFTGVLLFLLVLDFTPLSEAFLFSSVLMATERDDIYQKLSFFHFPIHLFLEDGLLYLSAIGLRSLSPFVDFEGFKFPAAPVKYRPFPGTGHEIVSFSGSLGRLSFFSPWDGLMSS